MEDGSQRSRKALRLANYDYAARGAYFVTVCCEGGVSRFGDVKAGVMALNDAGHAIGRSLTELVEGFQGGHLDAWVVMPNHVHFIVVLDGKPGRSTNEATVDVVPTRGVGRRGGGGEDVVVAPTLSAIVARWKSTTTRTYIDRVDSAGWPRFEKKLWKRSFYEHVIRDPNALNAIRAYIDDNPRRWQSDRSNPQSVHGGGEATEPWDV